MEAIDKVLKWAQLLQCSCFGTQICVNIDAGQGVTAKKLIHVSTCVGEAVEHYVLSSEMTTEEIYSGWGKIKDDVHKLITQYGRRINKHGRTKMV